MWFGVLYQSVGIRSPFIVGAVVVAISWFLSGRIPATLRPRRKKGDSAIAEAVESQTLAPE
jgi:hypothetical protein